MYFQIHRNHWKDCVQQFNIKNIHFYLTLLVVLLIKALKWLNLLCLIILALKILLVLHTHRLIIIIGRKLIHISIKIDYPRYIIFLYSVRPWFNCNLRPLIILLNLRFYWDISVSIMSHINWLKMLIRFMGISWMCSGGCIRKRSRSISIKLIFWSLVIVRLRATLPLECSFWVKIL